VLKRKLPVRWNEVVGVQHMKIYVFDDQLILSGANLSNTYFIDRQDRYLMLSSEPHVAVRAIRFPTPRLPDSHLPLCLRHQ
jgi:CDP-diacylglycerol--glycerol-3-phosphate 3-phosphatidyltransferase